MIRRLRYFLVLVTVAVGLIPATAAQAQFTATFYGPPPPQALYPAGRPAGQLRAAPRLRKSHASRRPARVGTRQRRHALERRVGHSRRVVHTRRIVHEKPIVIETTRVVDDPPRVIERRHYIGESPAAGRGKRLAKTYKTGKPGKPASGAPAERGGKHAARGGKKGRVIQADAEVTILGPDRMIIRLFRKDSRSIASSAGAR